MVEWQCVPLSDILIFDIYLHVCVPQYENSFNILAFELVAMLYSRQKNVQNNWIERRMEELKNESQQYRKHFQDTI